MKRLSARLDRKPSTDLRKLESNPLPPTHDLDVSRVTDEYVYGVMKEKNVKDPPAILQRARISSQTVSRMPYFGLSGSYNKRWYVDTVTLPHNSIRALLSKLFSMANASVKIALDMSAGDFERVRTYLSHFHRYVSAVFEAEEKFLYATFESALQRVEGFDNEHPLHSTIRRKTKREILDAVSTLLSTFLSNEAVLQAATTEDGRMELAQRVRDKADDFTAKLLQYFNAKEKVLPRLVFNSVRRVRERNRQERLLIKFFAKLDKNKGDDEFFFAAILAVPLKVEEVREDFIKRHFGSWGNKREAFLKAADNVNYKLLGVVDCFENAEKKYNAKFSVEEFLSHYGEFQVDYSNEALEIEDGEEGEGEGNNRESTFGSSVDESNVSEEKL